MSCLYEVRYETVHGSVCYYVCVSNGLFACAVLLTYLHYSEEWVEVRDMLFVDQ